MRWLCAILGHRPDLSKARKLGGDVRAPCGRCAAPMRRDFWRGWHLVEPEAK